MNNNLFYGIMGLIVGPVVLLSAIFNSDWLMKSSKAKGMIALIGYEGTRIFYCFIGGMLLVIGIYFLITCLS